jgi:hypothetical protein
MNKVIRGWRELLKENLQYRPRQNIIMVFEWGMRLTEHVEHTGRNFGWKF